MGKRHGCQFIEVGLFSLLFVGKGDSAFTLCNESYIRQLCQKSGDKTTVVQVGIRRSNIGYKNTTRIRRVHTHKPCTRSDKMAVQFWSVKIYQSITVGGG